MKKFTSALAVVLSLLMILCSLPFSVMADPATTAYEKIGDTTTIADGTASAYVDGVMAAANFTNGNYYQRNATFYDSVASTKSLDGGKVFKNALASNGTSAANAAHNYGFLVDVFKPTISNVNGIALWVDFSEFESDDYWRILANNDTADDARAEGLNNATASAGAAGAHTAFYGGRGGGWTAANKPGTLTLINTETGEVTKNITFTRNKDDQGTNIGIGAFRIPAGFVGYAYFEFDNKTNEGTAAMNTLGSIGFYRRADGVAADSVDTTATNLNKLSNNSYTAEKPVFYYVGDVMAVSDIDVFAADVISGKLGKLASSGCGAAVDGTAVTVDAVDGAAKYVATALDEENGNALYDYAESETTNLTFTKDVAGKYVQIVALDAEGNQINVVSTHNIVTDTKAPTAAEDGYTKKQCSLCQKVFENTTIPATGYVGEINGMNSVAQVIRGYNGPIQFADYSVDNAYTGVTPYGPSLKYTLQQLWPGGAIAVALDLEGADGFAFYIDVGGAQYYADELADKAHTAANNYFDIGFGSSLHANFGTDAGKTNLTASTIRGASSGTVPEGAVIPVIGGWGANRNSGFISTVITSDNYNITFKLYNVKTRELTDGTYNMNNAGGSTKPRAEMVIPENFTGYVIVDLTNYNNDAYAAENNPPAIDDIKQIYIERTNDLKVIDTEGNEHTDGSAKVGYDNFFAIYDVAGMTASTAAFEEIISDFSVAYPKADSVFEVASGDDEGNVGFLVENFTPVSYRIYRPNASEDTLILQDTIPATTDADGNYIYHAAEGNVDFVQAIDAEGNASPVAVVDALCYHVWGEEIEVPSTCKEAGHKYKVCGKCDAEVITVEELPLADHTYNEEPDSSTDATDCQTPGTATYICAVCGHEDVREGVVGGHAWGEEQTEDSTCTKPGQIYKVCGSCGATEKVRDIPVKEHSYGDVIVDTAATCVTPGVGHKVCGACGDTVNNIEIPATGEHAWGEEQTEDSTCTKPGQIYKECGSCGATEKVGDIPVKEHSYGDVIVDTAATCVTPGVGHKVCGACGDTVDNIEIPATEVHTWKDTVITEDATCVADGKTYKECQYCDAINVLSTIEATGEHTKGEVVSVTDPTAESEGFTTYTCGVCGNNFNTDFVAAGATDEETGFSYVTVDGGIQITGYTGDATELTIPAEIGGKKVVSIAAGAFVGNVFEVVNLNATVTTTGTNVAPVFASNSIIVNIGADVKSIPAYLFYDVAVTELNFADNAVITTIGESAFVGNRIKTLVLPDSIELIDVNAFRGCIALETLKTGKGLRTIEGYAFALCYRLENVEFAEGLYKINNRAFYKASTMVDEAVTVLLPYSLGYYGKSNHAFQDSNVVLTGYKYSYAVNYITVVDVKPVGYFYKTLDESSFVTEKVEGGVIITSFDFAGLETTDYAIEIPATIGGEKVVGIAANAFRGTAAQKTVRAIKLPETVTSIGSQAFRAWIVLEDVVAPGVSNIGYRAFILCGKIKTFDMDLETEGTINNAAFNEGMMDTINFK